MQRQLMQDYWSFFQQLRYLSKNPNRNIIFIQNNCTKSKRNDLQRTILPSNNHIIYLDIGMSTKNPHNNTFW